MYNLNALLEWFTCTHIQTYSVCTTIQYKWFVVHAWLTALLFYSGDWRWLLHTHKCLNSLQAITSVHIQCHHSLRCIVNPMKTDVCRCVCSLCQLVWYKFLVFFFFRRVLLPSVFWCSFMSRGCYFLSQCVCWSFLHCKHPVYCFLAHSSPTLYSPTVWNHQKELVVSGFSESWGQQKAEWFSEAKFIPQSLLNLLLCPESQSAIFMTQSFLTFSIYR